MSEPFVGETRIFAFGFAPPGWMPCEGQLLPIVEYGLLYQLIGTTYGGDGQTTFALPDLRGRIPVHQGSGVPIAQAGGAEKVAVTVQQIPAHSHAFIASASRALRNAAAANTLAEPKASNLYGGVPPDSTLAPQTMSAVGGGQPHDNMQPYLCISFIISLFGIFPSPT